MWRGSVGLLFIPDWEDCTRDMLVRSGREAVRRRVRGPAMRTLLRAGMPDGGGGFCGLLKTLLDRRDGRVGIRRREAVGAASAVCTSSANATLLAFSGACVVEGSAFLSSLFLRFPCFFLCFDFSLFSLFILGTEPDEATSKSRTTGTWASSVSPSSPLMMACRTDSLLAAESVRAASSLPTEACLCASKYSRWCSTDGELITEGADTVSFELALDFLRFLFLKARLMRLAVVCDPSESSELLELEDESGELDESSRSANTPG